MSTASLCRRVIVSPPLNKSASVHCSCPNAFLKQTKFNSSQPVINVLKVLKASV